MDAMEIILKDSVPQNANIIGSHIRNLPKMDGRVKARICPWGNHESEKNYLRSDSPSMLMEVFRIEISIGVEKIGMLDQWKYVLRSRRGKNLIIQFTGNLREKKINLQKYGNYYLQRTDLLIPAGCGI